MFNISKFIKYGLYFIAFLPLLFTPFTFFPWHFGKTVIFQAVIEVLLILFFINKLYNSGLKFSVKSLLKNLNLLDWSVIIFLFILFVSSLTGANFVNSFWGNQARAGGVFTWLHFGAFYFLLVSFFQEKKEKWRQFSWLASGVGVIISFTALFPQILPINWQSIAGGGLIGNRAFLAAYLIILSGITISLLLETVNGVFYKKLEFWLLTLAAILFFSVILKTGTRGAYAGLLAGVFVGAVLSFFSLRDKKSKIIIAIVLTVIIGLSSGVFLYRYPGLRQLSSSLLTVSDFSFSGTAETRLMAWQIAVKGLTERPFLGWGWGNFDLVFAKYYNPDFLKYGFAETVWDRPHNWFLEIAGNSGLLGIVSYLVIILSAFYYLFCFSSKQMALTSRLVLSSALVAFLIQDFFLFETTNSLILWFALLAFISSRVKGIIPASSSMEKSKGWMKHLMVLFLLILLVVFFHRFYYLPFKSSYHMRQAELSDALMEWVEHAAKVLAFTNIYSGENAIFLAERFVKFDKVEAMAKDEKVESVALGISRILEEKMKKSPGNVAFSAWAGQVYMILGDKFDRQYFVDAERVLLVAQAASPQKQEILFLLGRFYLLKQDFTSAIVWQKKAVTAAPDIGVSHWFLGLSYVASGDNIKGLEEIEKAMVRGYNLTDNQRLYLFDLYGLEKQYAKLVGEYKKLIEIEPKNINWQIRLAVVYAEMGEKKSALEIAQNLINFYPSIKVEADEFIKKYNLNK